MPRRDYETFVAPHSSRVFAEISDFDVPQNPLRRRNGEAVGADGTGGAADVVASTGACRSTRRNAGSDRVRLPGQPGRPDGLFAACRRRRIA